MQALLAGLVLVLAGQVSGGGRYDAVPAEEGNPPAAVPEASPAADSSSQPTIASETPTAEQTDPYTQPQPDSAQAVAREGAASPAAAAPLTLHEPPLASKPDPAAPQRSVLAVGPKPSELMRQLMKPPAAGQLSGAPVTLGEAVEDARSRRDQTQRAKAYWNLSAAVADYYLALLENTELAVLRQSVTAPSKQWETRQREAQIHVNVALRAAQGAQLQLHQLLGRGSGGSLPLPSDVPHCGRYNAEYDEIFASRSDQIARQLSELLPLRYDDLRSQAQSVADAAAWREEMSRRRDPADDGIELLHAQDLLSLKRRAFIATARDYNQEIAAYTELAAPAEVAPDRLVAMMIRTSSTGGQLPWQSSGVEQASAREPKRPEIAAIPPAADARDVEVAGRPQTFAPENYREVRRPLQRLLDRGREHSIVSGVRKLRQRITE